MRRCEGCGRERTLGGKTSKAIARWCFRGWVIGARIVGLRFGEESTIRSRRCRCRLFARAAGRGLRDGECSVHGLESRHGDGQEVYKRCWWSSLALSDAASD